MLNISIVTRYPREKGSISGWTSASNVSTSQNSYVAEDKSLHTADMRLRNFDVVYIGDTGTARGLGVFASHNLSKGHKIIVEKPAISCIHFKQHKTAAAEWQKLPVSKQQELVSRFRKLKGVPVGTRVPLDKKQIKRLESFIGDYGFSDPNRGRAHVFSLTSHINHACRSCANAQHWTDGIEGNHMTVKLIKDVSAGDEIFVHYNRTKLGFGCAVCPADSAVDRITAFTNSSKRKVYGQKADSASQLGQRCSVGESTLSLTTLVNTAA